MQEEIVSGKKFRRLIDAATDKWQRISFWTKASDCIMEDENGNETTVENEIQNIKEFIENNKTANEDQKNQLLVYNEDSDYYQGFVDGNWKDMYYAGLNWDGYLIKDGLVNKYFNGIISIPYINLSHNSSYHANSSGGIEVLLYDETEKCIKTQLISKNRSTTICFLTPIDLSRYNFSKLNIEYKLTNTSQTFGDIVEFSLLKNIPYYDYYCDRNYYQNLIIYDTDKNLCTNKKMGELSISSTKRTEVFNIENLKGIFYPSISLRTGNYTDYHMFYIFNMFLT